MTFCLWWYHSKAWQNAPPVLQEILSPVLRTNGRTQVPGGTASVSCFFPGGITNTATPALPASPAPFSHSTSNTQHFCPASQCLRIRDVSLPFPGHGNLALVCITFFLEKPAWEVDNNGLSLLENHDWSDLAAAAAAACTSSPHANSFPPKSLLTFNFEVFVILGCQPHYYLSNSFL